MPVHDEGSKQAVSGVIIKLAGGGFAVLEKCVTQIGGEIAGEFSTDTGPDAVAGVIQPQGQVFSGDGLAVG